MKYDFDKVIDRKNTNSWKFDFYDEYAKTVDTQAMWIADMDFPTVPAVVDKMKSIADFGVYGYSRPREGYYAALNGWFKSRFNFDIKPEWVVFTPGVVFALNMAVKTFTKEGDGVLVQRPVYYPFLNAIKNNGRKLINNPLIYKDGKYAMDFDDLEKKIVDNNVRLMILCSPHNPVGRVWTRAELERVAEITLKHNVFVCADEIHCDFVYGDNKHTSYATLSEKVMNNCMVCTAPSKTFNLAGLQTSNIVIPNDEIRAKYQATVTSCGYEYPNIYGISACETAYKTGAEWLAELLAYLKGNYDYMVDFCRRELPLVKVADLQGTYLPWFDCRAYGYTHEELIDRVEKIGKLWLDEGTLFGEEGSGFIRFNIACPRSEIIRAMEGLKKALKK